MGYYRFKPYVSVATRREKAMRAMQKLKKKGVNIKPIVIDGRNITRTFWGKAWGDHIESFSDYENRLPRGRTYVRNGSVCHLDMTKGLISATVSGSRLYQVTIKIALLPDKQWQAIKQDCCGKIGSLLDLLDGSLSDEVMAVVCHREKGLFPHLRDIDLSCSCLDWATMCKHVAAVLYGVGARLDHSPKDLFQLRGLDHNELIDSATFAMDESFSNAKRLDATAVADIFNIDLPQDKKQGAKNSSSSIFPKTLTGIVILKKRQKLGLSQKEMSQQLNVSVTSISRWERSGGSKLSMNEKAINRLKEIW